MLQRSNGTDRASTVTVSKGRQGKPEERRNQTPGELVPAEKVEEILHGLDLPASGTSGEAEDHLAPPPDDYDRGSEEEEEETSR